MNRIISSSWRLQRLYGEMADRARKEADTYPSDLMDVLLTGDVTVTDEDKHREALSKAEEMEAKQQAQTATLGYAFMRDANKANAFSKLSRYKTTIERSLFKALHELQRLQAARGAGGNVSPPVAVDVDVSGVLREEL